MEGLFTVLTDWLSDSLYLALISSFIWGVLSIILSPCHLSSIPLIVGFISSNDDSTVKNSFLISTLFSVGILLTIVAIGLITASLGRMLGDVGNWVNYLIAVVFFVVGLYLLDLINLNWSFNVVDKIKIKGPLVALILGLLFGLAVGPCTFAYMAPILGVVFKSSGTDLILSANLLILYAIGHCSVIIFAGTMTSKVRDYLNWSNESKVLGYIRKLCGLLIIAAGIGLLIS